MRLSIDDGCASDVRVADLCRRYEIPCTFYWPVEWHSLALDNGYEPLSYLDAIKIAQDFEVGSHGVTHRHLTKLSAHEAAEEVVGSKFMLSRMFKQDINKFASSRGYSNPELDELILQHYTEHRKTKQPGLVHIHPNSGANDNRPWRECVDEDTRELFGHSWEFDKYNLWDELEEFLRDSHS